MTQPPRRTKRTAVASVSSGGPNPRATAASNLPAHPGSSTRLAVSAQTTRTRGFQPSVCTARASSSVRFARRSTSVTLTVGRSRATISPGTPAPEPRSTTRSTSAGRAATNDRACSMTSAIGRTPSAPWRWARVKTRTTSSAGESVATSPSLKPDSPRPQTFRSSAVGVGSALTRRGLLTPSLDGRGHRPPSG